MLFSRRKFIKTAAAGSVATLLGLPGRSYAANGRVVVIGGGCGGATAARYLRQIDPTIQVTLIEAKTPHHTCLMSNEVLAGNRKISSLQFDYLNLSQLGVKVVADRVVTIDAEKQQIKTAGGEVFPYERCIVSPGIDFRWQQIEGYDAEAARIAPHAWQSGAQLITLQRALQAMPDGGTVLITVPEAPYRCPAAPYERASLIARYLQRQKPRSKVVMLDANTTFFNQKAFFHIWKKEYAFANQKSLIERHSGEAVAVAGFDATNRTIITRSGQQIKADVINIIPPQKAGEIAISSGLVDQSGWCPIDLLTFESSLQANIHIIGDAAIIPGMSKSGASANTQGKACAAAVAALLNGEPPLATPLIETRYAILGEETALSSTAVFKSGAEGNQLHRLSGESAITNIRKWSPLREFYNAHSWYNNITRDIFG